MFKHRSKVGRSSHSHLRVRITCFALLAVNLSLSLTLKSAPPESRTAPVFKMILSERSAAKSPKTTLCLVTTETNKFSFVLPKDLKARVDAEHKTILLYKSDNSCAIQMQISEDKPAPASLRQRVLAANPGAEIVEEFTTSTAGASCPAFDLKRSVNGFTSVSRVVYVSFPSAEVELKLTAPVKRGEKMDNHYALLNDIGLSFWRGALNSPWKAESKLAVLE